ncbi:hypothetical protein G9A89_007608 [Geosiphon pyriformis]|nr:hypothetical protein G9A89_007608 [Geosiphon pyriformis]
MSNNLNRSSLRQSPRLLPSSEPSSSIPHTVGGPTSSSRSLKPVDKNKSNNEQEIDESTTGSVSSKLSLFEQLTQKQPVKPPPGSLETDDSRQRYERKSFKKVAHVIGAVSAMQRPLRTPGQESSKISFLETSPSPPAIRPKVLPHASEFNIIKESKKPESADLAKTNPQKLGASSVSTFTNKFNGVPSHIPVGLLSKPQKTEPNSVLETDSINVPANHSSTRTLSNFSSKNSFLDFNSFNPHSSEFSTQSDIDPFQDSHALDPFADYNDLMANGSSFISDEIHEEPEVFSPVDRRFSEVPPSKPKRIFKHQPPSSPPLSSSSTQSLSLSVEKDHMSVTSESPPRDFPNLAAPLKPPRLIGNRNQTFDQTFVAEVKPSLPPRPMNKPTLKPENFTETGLKFSTRDRPPLPDRPALSQRSMFSIESEINRPQKLSVPKRDFHQNHSGSESSVGEADSGEDLLVNRFTSDQCQTNFGFPDATHANRRAPHFNELVEDLYSKSSIRAFGIAGDLVVTASTSTRVWKLRTAENIATISHGDSKVTCLKFRPARRLEDIGRYIWCGTNDGALFALDINTRKVVEMTSKAHNHSINFILSHESQLWTIDENGKLNLWSPDSNNHEVPSLESSPRPLRVASKQTCALIVNHNLWMGAGKSIEVFNPVEEQRGSSLPSKREVGSDVGNVTCMAQTNEKSFVYIGHDNGTFTIWDVSTFSKLSVVPVSNYCITSSLGVGEYLWAGFKTGKIYVYDTRKTKGPWMVLKEWQAHKTSVIDLLLDDEGLWREKIERLQVGSLSDEGHISVWDGLMQEDWLANEMVKYEQRYCTYQEIKILICSWNIDASKPADLEASAEDVKFLRLCFTSIDAPDLIVIGFQEIIDLESKKMTAKTMLMSKKKADKQLNENITQRYRLWRDKLVRAVREHAAFGNRCDYKLVKAENLVGLFTCVFVKDTEWKRLKNIDVTKCKTGLGGYHGNKGAIATRFIYDDSSICFVNCHLAAGQTHITQRNHDSVKILESAEFPALTNDLERNSLNDYAQVFVDGGDGANILDHEICFLSGDLNYRIDLPREVVIEKVRKEDFATLLENDQLIKQRLKNPGFRLKSFNEGILNFAPTYKYNPGEDTYDSSDKKRTPAWCDRILWRGNKIKQVNYQRYECKVSDHRPISGAFIVNTKAIDKTKRVEIESEVKEKWNIKLKEEIRRKKLAWLSQGGWDIEVCRKVMNETDHNLRKAIEILNRLEKG